MISLTSVVALFTDLGEAELVTWVERGWVRPEGIGSEAAWAFHDIDVARIRLIHDLSHRMELEEDAIPLVLSLLDQIHDLRGQLRSVLRAIEAQPDDVQKVILAAL
jgi:chaperone modulatory protein CbpM